MTKNKKIIQIKEAQDFVNNFAKRNNWEDIPNIDKLDHLHEELIEISQHLRYKSKEERIKFVKENQGIFLDGIGDLFFGICRLANQLNIDIEEAFNFVKDEIIEKYNHKSLESKIIKKK